MCAVSMVPAVTGQIGDRVTLRALMICINLKTITLLTFTKSLRLV